MTENDIKSRDQRDNIAPGTEIDAIDINNTGQDETSSGTSEGQLPPQRQGNDLAAEDNTNAASDRV